MFLALFYHISALLFIFIIFLRRCFFFIIMNNDFYISPEEIKAQFLQFMLDNNAQPYDLNFFELILDGQIHRYRLQDDNKTHLAGAYCVWTDYWPCGWVQNWKSGDGAISWKFDRKGLSDEQNKAITDKEWDALIKKSQKHQLEMKKQIESMFTENSQIAENIFGHLHEAQDIHPYLKRKKVLHHGLRVHPDTKCLAVPLHDIHGSFMSIQWIFPAGDKRYALGCPKKGAFFSFFNLVHLENLEQETGEIQPILIGEGFATMATVYEITNYACVAAMDCGNIRTVAQAIKKKFPKNKILIMADNDHNSLGNPGLVAAENAVMELKLNGFIAPDFSDNEKGSDWNDFCSLHGYEKTKKILLEKIRFALLTPEEQERENNRAKLKNISVCLNPEISLPPQEFIGGLFPRKFLSLLAAPSGTGKTIFMQKFVSDTSIGGNILGGFATEEPIRKSLIFAGEAGFEMLVRRGAAMKWLINPENVHVVDQHDCELQDINVMLDSQEGFYNVQELIDIHKPDCVFFDTFSSFHESDENKAKEMKPIIKNLATLARDCNSAIVLVHHSRKRTAKERALKLNQDDVIGSSIINRLVALIIGIEPMNNNEDSDSEKILLVRPLKTWFASFMPFTYKLSEGFYGGTEMLFDLAPKEINNSRIAVWNYLCENFKPGEWFSLGHIVLSDINPPVSERQIKRILAEFLQAGKLEKRGSTRNTEYMIISNSAD